MLSVGATRTNSIPSGAFCDWEIDQDVNGVSDKTTYQLRSAKVTKNSSFNRRTSKTLAIKKDGEDESKTLNF